MNSYKQNKRPLQPITYLLSVLFLFTLALPQPVFASTAHTTVVSDNPTPTPTVPPDPGFVQAKGSVVRLLVSYTDPTDKTVANCTGLGILIKSLSPSSGTPNDWVLTDGVLLDKAQAMCATDHPVGTLSQVQIYFNTANTGKTRMIQVDSASNPPVSNAITCSDPKNCSNGPALIAFHGEQVPFVDLATVSSGTPPSPIGLTDHEGTVNIPPSSDQDSEKYTETIKGFLIPQPVDARNAANKLEAGTPLLDSKGHLTNLHLSSDGATFNLNAATSLIAQTDNNPLPTPTPTPVPQQTSGSFIVLPVLNISLDIWQFIILVIVLLAVLLFVGLFIRSRAQQHHPSFKADLDEAERYAASVAQEIEAMETRRRTWAEQNAASEQPTLPVQQQGLQDKTVMRRTVGDLFCPRCGEVVARDANYCPNCRLLLSPTESGLHLRVVPSASSAQSSMAPAANSNARAVPSPSAPVSPISPFADQPTRPPLPPSLVPSPDPVAEHPTIEMSPDITWKRPDSGSDNTTVTYPLQQVQAKRLGFVVGTRSDPGLKRKYKPNEDSLLAAQGLIKGAPEAQTFGLFVIADGMGGHANGQDASRLAIKMIVEHILPKLVNNGVGVVDYAQVLVDGIQSANQAVHQQNMEKRGDMGTTLTSALVVGPTAYVANVGDSRTYLYRESDGLAKVTNDHSVVASLVEAGIIKPDDIYTHPKRNQIYRSLGEKANVEIDIFTEQLREGDKLLLCSDGLWDMVRDPKIEEVIKRPVPNPSMTGDDLIKSALDGGGEDNVSVIVVQMTEAGNPEGLSSVQFIDKPDGVMMPQF